MSSDKRRHGASNHVLRTSSARSHHGAGTMSSSAATGANSAGSHLPAMPQRVAVANAAAAIPEDALETDKDKDKEKEEKTTSAASMNSAGAGAGSVSRTSSSKTSKEKQRDRESASLAAQVRHKDDRIAHLENELDTMERAFQTQLDRLSASESETATFWQAKHSGLHQQYLRTDAELRLLRAEVDVREAERGELRAGWEVLRREVKEREEEVKGLRAQVRGLKEFVSTSTRADGQTSDEVFGDGMARLGNGLQNWVISHFRRAKIGTYSR